MIKKRRFLLIFPIILLAVLLFCFFKGSQPVFPKKHGHVFLQEKDKGDLRTLTGNVLFAVFFAGDSETQWSEAKKEGLKHLCQLEADILTKEAQKYNTDLNISFVFFDCIAQAELDLFTNSQWIAEALTSAGLPEKENTVSFLKDHYEMDEAVVIFALQNQGRSYALPETNDTGFECAFIYNNGGFRHEILHLFGAKDFYYPQKVTELAKESFPDSVMLNSENHTVDDFTAYLIGWTQEPSAAAQAFIDETSKISQKDINEATEQETLTGYGQKIFNNGIYEGILVDGIRHGEGTLYFNNGDVYTGSFKNGELEGFGTYTWANGDTYTGDFSMGKPFGQGTRTWANGETYTGGFVDGIISGKGTLTMEDGTVYTGDFISGYRTGKATVTYPDGTKYTGDFLRGDRKGNGELIMPDGTKYTGEFDNDAICGQGTMTYPDGSVYTGEFNNGKKSGQGTITYPDGSTYTGYFLLDKYQG